MAHGKCDAVRLSAEMGEQGYRERIWAKNTVRGEQFAERCRCEDGWMNRQIACPEGG